MNSEAFYDSFPLDRQAGFTLVNVFHEAVEYSRNYTQPFDMLNICIRAEGEEAAVAVDPENGERRIERENDITLIPANLSRHYRMTTRCERYGIHFRLELYPGRDVFQGMRHPIVENSPELRREAEEHTPDVYARVRSAPPVRAEEAVPVAEAQGIKAAPLFCPLIAGALPHARTGVRHGRIDAGRGLHGERSLEPRGQVAVQADAGAHGIQTVFPPRQNAARRRKMADRLREYRPTVFDLDRLLPEYERNRAESRFGDDEYGQCLRGRS